MPAHPRFHCTFVRSDRSSCMAALLPCATLAVDCWIGVCDEGDRRVVRLAGRLCEDQVPDLLRSCGTPPLVTLDLTDLVSTDDAGIDALNRIRVGGGTLTGAPHYIQLKLDAAARRRADRWPGDLPNHG
jgi:hypothetical protein